MDVQARVSAVVKVSKVVNWSRIFVRIFHNFRAIPIMNPLTRVHDKGGLGDKTNLVCENTL